MGEVFIFHLRAEWGKDEMGLPVLTHIGEIGEIQRRPDRIIENFLEYQNKGSIYESFKILEETVKSL
ncbi:hypothetical protein [Paenibacillus sp. YPG26]|uniref:hypothetical protein n=1 Tax=Paenibacillus sp. YPG26 TaxID=2878915 RepID=UPI0020410108|nr:hypothetical protein [Paenibacillus sp. YPG26]USB32454.1 hypothetical protein LDO05_14260 [Paenibacillus sp. YPG26]